MTPKNIPKKDFQSCRTRTYGNNGLMECLMECLMKGEKCQFKVRVGDKHFCDHPSAIEFDKLDGTIYVVDDDPIIAQLHSLLINKYH